MGLKLLSVSLRFSGSKKWIMNLYALLACSAKGCQ